MKLKINERRALYFLFVIQIILLAVLSTVSVAISEDIVPPGARDEIHDPDLYYVRAKTIIEGKVLYRDVATETPPLINYLLVIPYLMGGTILAYCTFFSIITIGITYTLYYFLSKINKRKALLCAYIYGLSPVILIIPTILKDDESLAVFFVIFPLLLSATNYKKYSKWITFILSIGIWTKIFPLIVAFSKLVVEKERNRKILDILIYALVSVAVCIPFLILAGDDFTWFLRFYFLGISFAGEGNRIISKGLEGQSFWRILDSHGIHIPDTILIVTLAICVLIMAYLSYRKNFNFWKTTLLFLLLFFILYPKIHTPYYVYLFVVLTPYLLKRERFLLFVSLNTCILITHAYKMFVIDWGWLRKDTITSLWGFSSVIATMAILWVLLWLIYHEKTSWLDANKVAD